jgi:hypothetical protein
LSLDGSSRYLPRRIGRTAPAWIGYSDIAPAKVTAERAEWQARGHLQAAMGSDKIRIKELLIAKSTFSGFYRISCPEAQLDGTVTVLTDELVPGFAQPG